MGGYLHPWIRQQNEQQKGGWHDTHSLKVSRQTASRYGKAASSSYPRFPWRFFASTISWRSLLWTSWCIDSCWSIRASIPEVVSIPAIVKVLLGSDMAVKYEIWHLRYLTDQFLSWHPILFRQTHIGPHCGAHWINYAEIKGEDTHSRCSIYLRLDQFELHLFPPALSSLLQIFQLKRYKRHFWCLPNYRNSSKEEYHRWTFGTLAFQLSEMGAW